MEVTHMVDKQPLGREGTLEKSEKARSTKKSTLRFRPASERKRQEKKEE